MVYIHCLYLRWTLDTTALLCIRMKLPYSNLLFDAHYIDASMG